MPTSTLSSALLLLSNSEGLPWAAPPWEAITKVVGLPWFFDPNAADDSPTPNYACWTVGVAKTVKTFVETIWALPEQEQEKYTTARKADNDTAGRTAWNRFVKDTKISTSINKVIDDVLSQHDRGPYQVMAQHETRTVSEPVEFIHADLIPPFSYLLSKTPKSRTRGFMLPRRFSAKKGSYRPGRPFKSRSPSSPIRYWRSHGIGTARRSTRRFAKWNRWLTK